MLALRVLVKVQIGKAFRALTQTHFGGFKCSPYPSCFATRMTSAPSFSKSCICPCIYQLIESILLMSHVHNINLRYTYIHMYVRTFVRIRTYGRAGGRTDGRTDTHTCKINMMYMLCVHKVQLNIF